MDTVSPHLLRPFAQEPVVRKGQTEAEMRQTAEAFEASFLSQMLKPMFESLSTEAPFGGGTGEEMWRSFLVEEMAKHTARSGGVGIADKVMSHMLKAQEGLV